MSYRITTAALLLLFAAATARAGLYNPAEMNEEVVDPDYRTFSNTIVRLQRFYNPSMPSPLRKRAELATAFLPENLRTWRPGPEFTADYALCLSGYLLRRDRPNDAIDLLTNMIDRDRDNFLLYSNLGTAYQMAGLNDRALFYLKRGLDRWPARLEDLSTEQRKYFAQVFAREYSFEDARLAEQYHLKLVMLRVKAGKSKQGADVVHLLLAEDGKPIRFVAASGSFEPGKIAAEERKRLPLKSIEIVQQLLIWFPRDTQLYWLLGELYNAQGGIDNVKAADALFKIAVDMGERSPEFLDHRRILQDYLINYKEPPRTEDGPWNPSPWYMFALGFAAGVVVLLFALLQLRVLRRRRA